MLSNTCTSIGVFRKIFPAFTVRLTACSNVRILAVIDRVHVRPLERNCWAETVVHVQDSFITYYLGSGR